MKKIKQIVVTLLLGIFGCCMTVSAEEQKDNTLIQWKADENKASAVLTLAPTEEMTKNAATTLQITLKIVGDSQSISDVAVAFDEETAGKYRITDYVYRTDTKELNIFLSGPKALFDEADKACTVGTVDVSTADANYDVTLMPVAVKYVDQSHMTREADAQELQNMGCVLKADNGGQDNPSGDGTFEKADEVIKELENGEASEVTMVLDKKGTISEAELKAVFKALKGKDKSLTFAVKDGDRILYSFTFRGDQDIDENLIMDFKLAVGGQNDEIEGLMEKGAKNLILDFSHSGKLPAMAEIKVYVAEHFADGEKLYLYYYNPETKAVEPVWDNLIVVDGYVTFEMTHCSTYVLTTKKVKEAGTFPNPGEQTSSEQNGTGKGGIATGDTAPVIVFIVLALAAAAVIAAVIIRKKRK